MSEARERIILLLAAISLVALAAALTGSAILFSTCVSLWIGFGFALAYVGHLRRLSVSLTLVATFVALTGLFAAAYLIHNAGSPLKIAFGLPLQTALFVWIIWPMGGVMAVLHVITFDKLLLPAQTVENIRAQFGRSHGQ